jgi:glycosyltransferase involved in cell wall biosynthesis
MRIIEFMGPDASIAVPVVGDGGRERVIESLAVSLSAFEKVESVTLIAQSGSYLDRVTIQPVRFQNGLDPAKVLNDAKDACGKALECDILHVHHPAYLPAREFISARKVILTHHGAILHPLNFAADGITFVSHFLRGWMCRDEQRSEGPQIRAIHNPVEPMTRVSGSTLGERAPIGFMGALDKSVKRVDIALALAKALRVPLWLAGPCEPDFLNAHVLPQMGVGSRYLGEVAGESRRAFFENVTCMVCPNDSPEAFCLVAAEAMIMGVPVLGSTGGALPEVVEHGISGYVCANLDDYVQGYRLLADLDREQCSQSAHARFCPQRISAEYLNFFQDVLDENDL